MKTKRLIVALLLACVISYVNAEDIIQVIPFQTTAGMESDEETTDFYITMNNSSADIWAFQIDIKLPEGMTFDEDFPLDFYIDEDTEYSRFPYTKKGKRLIFNHNDPLLSREKDGGWRTIVVSTDDDTRITGNSGILLKVFYNTDENMKPGIYPIYVRGTVMTITGTSDIKPVESSSYVIIGDNNASNLDMSSLTGYVPSFVVEQLNADMASNTNLAMVNLAGATELGAELVTPDNVVSVVGTTGTLKREFTATYWSTVCLPFALNATQVAALNDEGVEIEEFTDFDETAGTVTFEPVTTMEANTPYIVKSQTTQSPFTNLTNVNLSTAEMNNVVVGKMAFIGTFEKQTLNSSTNTTFYAYNASNGNFVRIGSNATVPPFRAYLKLDNSAGARSFIVNHGDGEATGISTQQQGCSKTGVRYNLLGIPQAENSNVKGIHIQNGQKIVVR